MKLILTFFGIFGITASALADIPPKPKWADLDYCPSQDQQLAAQGETHGYKAENEARNNCNSEAAKYLDQTSCQVSCKGHLFSKKCQWQLHGIKKANRLDFDVFKKEKLLLRQDIYQPWYRLPEHFFQMEDHSVVIPNMDTEAFPYVLSHDLTNRREIQKIFNTEPTNIFPTRNGFFVLNNEVKWNVTSKLQVFYTDNLGTPPRKLLDINLAVHHGYYDWHYFEYSHNVSYQQSSAAINLCDLDSPNASTPIVTCNVYLLDASGVVYSRTYATNSDEMYKVSVGANKSIWLYGAKKAILFNQDSQQSLVYDFEFPQFYYTYISFTVPPINYSENQQVIQYYGPTRDQDFYLLDQTGHWKETYPVRRLNDKCATGTMGNSYQYVNYDPQGRPQSFSSNAYFSGFPEKGCDFSTTFFQFCKDGKLVNRFDFAGHTDAPFIHRRNEMELILKSDRNHFNGHDSRPDPITLALFDSYGILHKSIPITLPPDREATSSLISLGSDRSDDTGADFAIAYAVLKSHNSSDGDAFLQSFRLERQCLDYEFRKKSR